MQTICLVEDDPGVRMLLQWVLADQLPICAFVEAASGRDFLALLEQHTPDLVLLDVQLPDVSGITLYKLLRLRADLQEVPVLFVTANPYLVREGGLAGPYACLTKPFDNAELVRRVQALLDRGDKADVADA